MKVQLCLNVGFSLSGLLITYRSANFRISLNKVKEKGNKKLTEYCWHLYAQLGKHVFF